ncbi:Cna B-type domain-containing protein [Lapidilactobacillus wuchangensis]|uniref:Cna B-type domain-containing protein n=1 Tax=Lapidilactobacillus wuchangensis TaxID=2486001 RepID=UPI001CDD43B6|nr:Cna B-type domain-containing protein [Lapidilactobacillus wuchangensis]
MQEISKRHWFYVLVVMVTLISQFLYLPTYFLSAATRAGQEITVDGLGSLDAKDSQGRPIDASDWTIWNSENINYHWQIADGLAINDGDYATLNLPAGTAFQQNYQVEITDPDGNVVGTFIGRQGESSGQIVFNDYYSTHTEERHGDLNFTIKGTKAGEEPPIDGDDLYILKAGWALDELNEAGYHTKAQWQILINSQGDTLNNVTVIDTLDTSNQTLDLDSIRVEYQGSNQPVPPENYTIETDGETLKLVWHGPMTEAVNIFYTTTITDEDYLTAGKDISLKNTASITATRPGTGDGEETNIDQNTENSTSSAQVDLGAKGNANGQVGVTTISGQKSWADADDQDGLRPDKIVVELYANQVKVDAQVVTATNNWQYRFSNKPKYSQGQLINYTVKEAQVPAGYQSVISGTNITNVHVPELITIAGTKTWQDQADAAGKRPTKIEVQLLANGELIKSQMVNATENWQYQFTGLPKYQAGQQIKYEIAETAVPDYQTTVNGYDLVNTLVDSGGKGNLIKQPPVNQKPEKPATKQQPLLPQTGETIQRFMSTYAILLLALGATTLLSRYLKRRSR